MTRSKARSTVTGDPSVVGGRRSYAKKISRGEATLILWLIKRGDFKGRDYSTACLASMRAMNILLPGRPIPSVPESITVPEARLLSALIDTTPDEAFGRRRFEAACTLNSRAWDTMNR
jgi:hypothetical protein